MKNPNLGGFFVESGRRGNSSKCSKALISRALAELLPESTFRKRAIFQNHRTECFRDQRAPTVGSFRINERRPSGINDELPKDQREFPPPNELKHAINSRGSGRKWAEFLLIHERVETRPSREMPLFPWLAGDEQRSTEESRGCFHEYPERNAQGSTSAYTPTINERKASGINVRLQAVR